MRQSMLVSIPALNDNYIWLYGRENLSIIVVDIPDIAPLRQYLQQHHISVAALFLTHHHNDHTQGVMAFRQDFPNTPVFGPEETRAKGASHIINAGKFSIPVGDNGANYHIEVIETGGHTEQHLSYLIDGHLFCGDSLFSAGCGRVFTGNYQQMFEGLQRINQLPDSTLICAGHEYTLSNLAFAQQVLPNNLVLEQHLACVQALRRNNQPSLPTKLSLEKQINPFLQAQTVEQFIQLRQAKDIF